MAPITLILIMALLALESVVGAHVNKVMIGQFISRNCTGHYTGKRSELVQNKCIDISAQSIEFLRPKKEKDFREWAGWVGRKERRCYGFVYAAPGCQDIDRSVERFELPAQLEQCIGGPEFDGIQSAKFWCEEPQSTKSRIVESRGKHPPFRSVWMRHPFGPQPLCYSCWLRHKKNDRKFTCESSKRITPEECGPRPDSPPTTTTSTRYQVTLVTQPFIMDWMETNADVVEPTGFVFNPGYYNREYTIDERSTDEDSTDEESTDELPTDEHSINEPAELAKRWPETKTVRIKHPYHDQYTCARAAFKHQGKKSEEIILNGPVSCKHVLDDDLIELPPRPTVTIATTVITSTATVPY